MAPVISITEDPSQETLRAWFKPILQHGSEWCAPNLRTQCAFLKVGDIELPLTVNESDWDNSWLCSPYTHYVSYAREEIRRAMPTALAASVSFLLSGLGRWFQKASLNRVVMVNNWLMSTNPWPAWDGTGLEEALWQIRSKWPDHAIVFRSLNRLESPTLLDALLCQNCRIIPSRQVWWYEPQAPRALRSRDLKKDIRLLHDGRLRIVPHEELNQDDFRRFAHLYDSLYLQKYSQHNPKYREEWLRYCWQEHLLQFTALRASDRSLVGVEACGAFHGVMVSPVVGYLPGTESGLGLYRRLASIPVLTARSRGLPLNLSAGVGRFKALRGGSPTLEYVAVADQHLPSARQRPWAMIQAFSERLLAPVVQRLGL